MHLAICLALGLCATWPASASAGDGPAQQAGEPAGAEPVRRATTASALETALILHREDPAALGRDVLALGAACVPEVLEALRRAQPLWPTGGAGDRPLPDSAIDGLLLGLRALPTLPVVDALSKAAAPGASSSLRCNALQVLNRLGTRAELGLLFEIAVPPSAAEPAQAAAEPPLEPEGDLALNAALGQALQGLLAREARVPESLRAELEGLPDEPWNAAVDGLTASRARGAAGVLAESLQRWPGRDVALLSHIERLCIDGDREIGPDGRARLRACLRAPEPATRRLAFQLGGRLVDIDWIEPAIAGLEDPDASVRSSAHWALAAITGQRFRRDPQQWRAWFEQELAWWGEHGEALLAQLEHIERPQLGRALQDLVRHRLHRERIATALLPLLGREDAPLCALVCAALGQLGAPAALPALERELEDRAEPVRLAAAAALRRLRGGASAPARRD